MQGKYLKQDIRRYYTKGYNPVIFIGIMFLQPGLLFSILYRLERYLIYESPIKLFNLIGKILYPIYFLITYYLLSYNIKPICNIKGGLFLHNRNIVITDEVVIGNNFSIMGGVTIGTGFKSSGKINIGHNVWCGTGSKIISNKGLEIADGIKIGANAVVTKDLTIVNGVYIGIPAKYKK